MTLHLSHADNILQFLPSKQKLFLWAWNILKVLQLTCAVKAGLPTKTPVKLHKTTGMNSILTRVLHPHVNKCMIMIQKFHLLTKVLDGTTQVNKQTYMEACLLRKAGQSIWCARHLSDVLSLDPLVILHSAARILFQPNNILVDLVDFDKLLRSNLKFVWN